MEVLLRVEDYVDRCEVNDELNTVLADAAYCLEHLS